MTTSSAACGEKWQMSGVACREDKRWVGHISAGRKTLKNVIGYGSGARGSADGVGLYRDYTVDSGDQTSRLIDVAGL